MGRPLWVEVSVCRLSAVWQVWGISTRAWNQNPSLLPEVVRLVGFSFPTSDSASVALGCIYTCCKLVGNLRGGSNSTRVGEGLVIGHTIGHAFATRLSQRLTPAISKHDWRTDFVRRDFEALFDANSANES